MDAKAFIGALKRIRELLKQENPRLIFNTVGSPPKPGLPVKEVEVIRFRLSCQLTMALHYVWSAGAHLLLSDRLTSDLRCLCGQLVASVEKSESSYGEVGPEDVFYIMCNEFSGVNLDSEGDRNRAVIDKLIRFADCFRNLEAELMQYMSYS